MSAANVQKNKGRPWTLVYLGGRVIGPRGHVEMRHNRSQSRENQGVALWHPVIEPRRVSEYELIK